MAYMINQTDIPTLPSLYQAGELTPSSKPLFAHNATINAKIGLIRTDITKLHLPNGAIVNAANESLRPGGGVCGAIHSAAGCDLADECSSIGRCATGQAKMTSAYKLLCRKVIHAVGPIYWVSQKDEHSRLLGSCYTETLKLCVGAKLTAVAFCALSTGVYGYPSYEAAETALRAVREFLETEEGKEMEFVVFCNFERKDEVAYNDLISTFFPPAKPEDPAEDPEPITAAESSSSSDGASSKDPAKDPEPITAAESSSSSDGAPSKDPAKSTTTTSSKPTPTAADGLSEKETVLAIEKLQIAAQTDKPPAKPLNATNSADDADDADDFVLVGEDDM